MFWKKFVLSSVFACSTLGFVACGASDAPVDAASRPRAQAVDACTGDACARTDGERKRCEDKAPNVRHVSKDPRECEVTFFVCNPGESAFFNECGCGCALTAP